MDGTASHGVSGSRMSAAVAQILSGDGDVVGAGFLVGDRALVTCAHVVEDAGGGPGASIRLGFPHVPGASLIEGVVDAALWRHPREQDVAIVRLDQAPQDVQALALASAAGCRGHQVHSFGFPLRAPEGGRLGFGVVGDMLPGSGSGSGRLLQLTDANDLTTGFSGAPVMNEIRSRVIGMVTAIAAPDDYLRGQGIAYATPTEVLREVYPDLAVKEVAPYLHLKSFTEEDKQWFHGRDAAVEPLLKRLEEHRGALLLGPSGSGKTSLVQAGLLPKLAGGRRLGGDRWLPVLLRPGGNLAAELERELPGIGAKGIVAAARRKLADKPGYGRLLVVVDQFEEVLTGPEIGGQALDGSQAAAVRQLAEAFRAEHAPLSVILVMRDDFYPRLAAFAPDLLEAAPHTINVPATLSERELREIITKPASSVGSSFEAGLPDRIIGDLLAGDGDQTGTAARHAPVTLLPLLELALTQLWGQPRDGYLTHDEYHNIGEVTGSLASWCNQVLADLSSDEQRSIAQRVLTALVRPADEARTVPATRQRRPLGTLRELAADTIRTAQDGTPAGRDVDDVLEELTAARIITIRTEGADGHGAGKQPVAELIHESVIRFWPELRRWVSEDRQFQDWLGRASGQQRRWAQSKKPGDLLGATDQAEGDEARKSRALPREISEFLDAGSAAARARIRTTYRVIAGLVALTVLAVVGAAVAWDFERTARHEAAVAVSDELALESLNLDATDPYTARQLAVAAWALSGTAQAGQAEAELLVEQRGTIITPDRPVFSLTYNQQGTVMASAGGDGTVRLWNTVTQRQIGTIITGAGGANVPEVVFNRAGTLLATAGGNGTVRLWDPASRQRVGAVMTATDNGSPVLGIAFNPAGTLLATAGGDGTVRLWNTATEQQVDAITPAAGVPVSSVAFSPDGALLATADDTGSVRLWNAVTRTQVGVISASPNGPVAIAFDPTGTLLATEAANGTIRLWNTTTRQQFGTTIAATAGSGAGSGLSFNERGTLLATAAGNGTIRLWNTATQQQEGLTITATSDKNIVWDVAFNPTGTVLATAGGDGIIRFWNPVTQQLENSSITASAQRGAASAIAFNPTGTRLAIAETNGTVQLWDPATEQQVGTTITPSSAASAIAFNPTGTRLAIAETNGTVQLWNPATEQQVGTTITATGNGPGVTGLAFNPAGTQLAVADGDGTIRLWNMSTGLQAGPTIKAFSDVSAVAFNPAGTLLAGAQGDGNVGLWNPSNGQPAGPAITVAADKSIVWDVAFDPSGALLATASEDGTVRLWDAATGQPAGAGGTLTVGGPALKVTFSAHDGQLAAADGDGTVTLLDAADLTDPQPVLCAAFGLPSSSVWSQYVGSAIPEPASC